MVDRTLLSAVLGVGLGLVLVAFPAAVIRAHTAGRVPSDRGGEYGQAYQPPSSWLWFVRAVGVAMVALGLYFGYAALA